VEASVSIERFWSDFFGVEPSVWASAGVTVTRHVGLGGYRGIWFFRRGARWILSAPEDWIDRLRSTTAGLDPSSFLDEATLRRLVGDSFDRAIGPAFRAYLDPAKFRPLALPSVRAVTASDRAMLEAVAADCRKTGWDPAKEATSFQHAIVVEGRIVALSGYRPTGESAGDPFVFVAEEHRRKGWGTAVLGAVVEEALANGNLVLFQTLESNEAAVRIALGLGFQRDSTHMAVRLKDS
jgi:GNAT superfamily N-acetyltransferase